MKRIVLLSLLIFPIFLFAQYPTFSNKQKLGVQTTGDGLIYRGNEQTPSYTPNNVNNAYFYLDTVRNTLKFYKTNQWFTIYPTASDTTSLGNFLLKSDTLAMLLPYLRKADTISLSNRINNKLSLADTASMLAPYLKLKDTTAMLSPYFRDSDTTMLNLSSRFNLKLNATDTVSLSNRINLKLNKTDTINLSNRIDLKLNKSDTVSLSNRINKKLDTLYVNYQTNVDLLTNKDTINITTLEAGAGINIVNNVISLDTTLLDSVVRVQNVYVKNGTGTVLNKGEAVYVTGAAGTNILVGRASNVAESTSSKTLGLTMTSIGVNGFGYVIKEGLLKGLNTNSAIAGDPIWLGVNGALIFGLANKPFAPKHLVYLGVVTDKNPSVGEVYVTVQNGFEIKELHDVQITDPVNKASLYYNSSESLWKDTTATLLVSDTTSMLSKYVNTYGNQTNINGNKTFNNVITIDSATVTGKLLVNTTISDAVKITSNTNSTNLELANNSGSSVSIKSSNKNMILQTDNTALVYLNGDNKKVGILTMTPQQELEVNGNARITGLNNNLVPTNLVGSSNNNDLTNVHLGEGLSFSNDTLKVDLTIIDTAIAASSITLVGNVSGTGSTNSTVNTTINNGVVTNDMLAGSISDSKLNTITTVGKISNTATTATSNNTNNAIVTRDGSGNFIANNITATLTGNASTATNVAYSGLTGAVPIWNQNTTGNAATVTSVIPSNFASQSANTVLAAPNGSSGTPTFRSLVSADIPNLNYLPLTGGTLTGGLTGTTGTFTGLNIVNPTTQGIFTLQSADNNTATRIQFKTTGNVRREIVLPTSDSNLEFRTSAIGGTQGGYSFYTRRNLNDEKLSFNIDLDGNSNFYGTLGVTGATTLSSTLNVNGSFNTKDFTNHTFVNYIQNGDFDLTSTIDASAFGYGYPYYIPLHWKSAATSRYVSYWSSTGGYNSPGSFKQYDGDASTGGALYQDVTNWQDLKGKTVTACGWFTKGTLTNSGNHAEIQINDGLTTTTTSIGTTTSWQRACVTKTISASATRVRVIVGCNLGVSSQGGAVSDIDAISLVIGEGKHEFSHKPLFDRDTQRLSGTLLIGYDSENNLAYNPSATSNLKVAGSTSLNGTLGVSGVTTLSNLSGGSTRMVVASTTGVLSTQAIPSGGSGTVTNVSAGSPANGLSVANPTTTPVISMALADNGVTGVVSNNTQSFSGSKTFINSIDVNGFTTANGGLIVNANASTSTLTNLIGISAANGIGKITTGSGLSLVQGVLSATGTGTVTNVSALTIGTSGTNITSSVANSTTTPVITLNIPDANVGVRGVVTSGNQSFGGSKTFNDNIFVNGVANFTSTAPGGFNVTGTNISFASYPAGTLSVNANGYVTSSSDSTLKVADGFIDSALVKINKLTPRYYYWKDNTLLNRQLGFFAQEVNSILGEEAAPTPTNGNKYGIYDISIVAYLVKAVQEQQLIIDTLKNEIDKIKEDIVKLKQN